MITKRQNVCFEMRSLYEKKRLENLTIKTCQTEAYASHESLLDFLRTSGLKCYGEYWKVKCSPVVKLQYFSALRFYAF